MAAPIPLSLLIDSATVEREDKAAEFGRAYLPGEEMRFVRFDPSKGRAATASADDTASTGTLFIDRMYSVPPTPPEVGARVTVRRAESGEEWRGLVSSVESEPDERGTHHWEVTLS